MCWWNFTMANDWDFYVDIDDDDQEVSTQQSPLILESIEYRVGACGNSRGYNLTPVLYRNIVQSQPTNTKDNHTHTRVASSETYAKMWIVCC